MPYSSIADIERKIDPATLLQLADPGGAGEPDAGIVEGAIADADSLIDAMISTVYDVPLASAPRVIREHSATIAVHHLHLYRSVDSPAWRGAYERALDFLKGVAEGKITIEGASGAPSPSAALADNLFFEAGERKFSRSLLGGW